LARESREQALAAKPARHRGKCETHLKALVTGVVILLNDFAAQQKFEYRDAVMRWMHEFHGVTRIHHTYPDPPPPKISDL
jgi:hypothetical protein